VLARPAVEDLPAQVLGKAKGMAQDDDADWRRAFFSRLFVCLGTPPLLLSCWGVLFAPFANNWSIVFLFAVPAFLLLFTALILGQWKRRSTRKDEEPWHMGLIGTIILGTKLFLCMCLILHGVQIYFRFR